jgi:Enhanced disease susceptibility 1 protein EP domain
MDADSVWLARAMNHRKVVEPIDIANYYRPPNEFWKGHPPGERHYLESDNRSERYVYIERCWERAHPGRTCPSSTEDAKREQAAIEAEGAAVV